MKKSLDAISPYYEVFNIRDARQLKVFTVQLQRYFREQVRQLDGWILSKDGTLEVSLTTLEDNLYNRFGITSQALRLFAEYAREQNWERSKTAVTGKRRYAGRDLDLGFGATDADDRWAIELNKQDQLPEELLMRFNAEVLFLHPPTKTEFGERIIKIHDELALACPTDEQLEQLAERALISCWNNRWLEAYASRMLRNEVW